MNPKLQQAMSAAREGRSKEAQVLLTQILSQDPEEAQAWFLLSHLVDSEQKQLAYLKKVLALDPHHEKAAQRLAHLEREPELQTLPEWFTEVGGETGQEATLFTQRLVPGQAEISATATSSPSMAELEGRKEQRAQLTRILVILILAAVVVLILLLYLVFTAL